MLLSTALHILGYDIWFYISHILLHTPLLWNIHKIHHEAVHPTVADTYKSHWFESPFQGLGFLAPLLVQPLDPWALATALLFVNIRGMARHDSRTVWLIGNHHLLHHQYVGCNYGEYWIDRLCGTVIKDPTKVKKGILYV